MDCKPENESFNWFGGFSQEDEDGIVPYMKWVLNKMKKMVEGCMIPNMKWIPKKMNKSIEEVLFKAWSGLSRDKNFF